MPECPLQHRAACACSLPHLILGDTHQQALQGRGAKQGAAGPSHRSTGTSCVGWGSDSLQLPVCMWQEGASLCPQRFLGLQPLPGQLGTWGLPNRTKKECQRLRGERGAETGAGAVIWHHVSQEDCTFYLPRNPGAGMQGRARRPVEAVLPSIPTLQGYAPASAPKQPWGPLAPGDGHVACSPLCWPALDTPPALACAVWLRPPG